MWQSLSPHSKTGSCVFPICTFNPSRPISERIPTHTFLFALQLVTSVQNNIQPKLNCDSITRMYNIIYIFSCNLFGDSSWIHTLMILFNKPRRVPEEGEDTDLPPSIDPELPISPVRACLDVVVFLIISNVSPIQRIRLYVFSLSPLSGIVAPRFGPFAIFFSLKQSTVYSRPERDRSERRPRDMHVSLKRTRKFKKKAEKVGHAEQLV